MSQAVARVVAIAAMLVLLVTVAGASKLTNLRNLNRNNEDNSIIPETKIAFSKRNWLKISQAPPNVVSVELGDRLELECEVTGSPPPSIQWIRGNNPQRQAEEFESNSILDHLGTDNGRAKTNSRLIIDCVLPQHEGLYTCVAVAGGRTTLAQPTMVLIQGSHANNLTALLSACRYDTLHADRRVARVTEWRPYTMQDMGGDVTLPCRAAGHPRPATYWLDGEDKLVGENDHRFKELPNGDLLIMKLRWSDMGTYVCVASNQVGSDRVESFVYPVKV